MITAFRLLESPNFCPGCVNRGNTTLTMCSIKYRVSKQLKSRIISSYRYVRTTIPKLEPMALSRICSVSPMLHRLNFNNALVRVHNVNAVRKTRGIHHLNTAPNSIATPFLGAADILEEAPCGLPLRPFLSTARSSSHGHCTHHHINIAANSIAKPSLNLTYSISL